MAIKVSEKNVLDINLGTDTEADANKKTALNLIGDYSKYKFTTDGKTLTISKGNDIITVSNTSKLKYFKSSNDTEYSDIVVSGLFDSVPVVIDWNKRKISGITNYNDTINLSGVELTGTKGFTVNGGKGNDTIIGSMNPDTIKGGDGNDFIYSSKGNDTITGGVGNNTIVYSGKFDTDTINLTKKENLILDLSDYEIESLDDTEKLITNLKGNDLRLEVLGYGTIILKNYTKNTLNSLSIKLNAETTEKNLNINSFSLNYRGSDFTKNEKKKTATITTSKYNDKINTTNLDNFAKTINAGEGNDFIYAGKGNDTIYGGNGSDKIFGEDGNDVIHCGGDRDVVYGGTGNDIIYGDSGYNAHYFKEGDGQDKLYMGKGADIIVFDKSLKNTLTFERVGNNLLINYGSSNDSVTVVNYFTTKTKSVETIVFADYNAQTTNISDLVGSSRLYLSDNIIQSGYYEAWEFYSDSAPDKPLIVNCQILNGDNNNNLIYSSTKYDIINSGGGDDNVYVQSKLADVTDISGNDKYFISSLKKGTILTDCGGLYDELVINDSYKNINFVFDVALDGYAAYDENRLYILSNSTLQKFVKSKSFMITSGIQVNDYFYSGTIEQIGTKDCYVTNNEIEKIKTNVKNWLKNSGYNTALQALMYGSSTTQKELLAIYKNIDWIKYTVNGTNKDDILNGTDYGETIYGNKGNDKIYAKGGDDYVDGGAGNDYIETTGGNSIIVGGDGNDTINALGGDSDIYGGNGDDTIYLGDGVNVVDAGLGNNTIVANNSSTFDIILNSEGNDTVKFNSPQNITYAKDNDSSDLYINYGDNTLLLNEYFNEDNFSVKKVDNNGVISNLKESVTNELYIYGSNADDTYKGTDGNDIFVSGSGNDIVQSSKGNDKLLFETQKELIFTRDLSNNDLTITHDTNSIKLTDYFKPNATHSVQTVVNGNDEYTIESALQTNLSYKGTTGADSIVGAAQHNIIQGNSGNDTLSSHGETCTYVFEQGDGVDTITSSNGEDIIKFPNAKQISYHRVLGENDLTIQYTNDDKIILKNYFGNDDFSVKKILNGETELTITEEVLNCLNITCKEGSQDIQSSVGNQVYDLSYGGNTVYFDDNSGNDSVENTNRTDKLVITNDGSDLIFTHNLVNNDLLISYSEDNTITIKDYFNNQTTCIDSIVFNDETLSISEEINKGLNIIDSGSGNSDIYGTEGNDTVTILSSDNNIYGDKGDDEYIGKNNIVNTYYIHSGDGNDFIRPGGSYNTLVFDVNIYKLLFNVPEVNKLLISGYGNENDKITCSQTIGYGGGAWLPLNIKANDITFEYIYVDKSMNGDERSGDFFGSTKNDIMIGSSKDETIKAFAGDDYINAGQGRDIINGGSGNNIMYFKAGDGKDTVQAGEGNDTLVFDTDFENLVFSNTTSLIVSGYGDENDSVSIVKTNSSVKTIVTNDRTITYQQALNSKYGTNGNDNLTASTYGGIVYGLAGDDILNGSNGSDWLNGGLGNDTLNGNNGNDTLIGGEGNDTIDGGYGDDILIGGNGNDTMDGEYGSDTLIGGDGDDTLKGGLGDGNDTLDGGAGNDKLDGGEGDDILIGGSGNNELSGNGGNDTYIISMSNDSYNNITYEWGGNDTVHLQGTKNNIAMYYNVTKNGYAYSRLYIKDKSCLTQKQGVEYNLFNYSDDYIMETIIIDNNTEDESDDYIWTYDGEQINTITAEVTSWLSTKDYFSVEDVINSGNTDDINSVLAIFDQVWQPRTV